MVQSVEAPLTQGVKRKAITLEDLWGSLLIDDGRYIGDSNSGNGEIQKYLERNGVDQVGTVLRGMIDKFQEDFRGAGRNWEETYFGLCFIWSTLKYSRKNGYKDFGWLSDEVDFIDNLSEVGRKSYVEELLGSDGRWALLSNIFASDILEYF